MDGGEILSVRELTWQIKRYLEQNEAWRDVWVKGEISNFKHHNRGHMYFSLKDEYAKIQCVMFSRYNQWLKFKPEDGMKVLARGEVNVYERDGQYQLYVKEMQPDGLGALFQAFEELKEKLRQRGWFDPERKKPIPSFPRRIGVVTSPTGAAVRDIITTIKRRFPIAEVVVIPVLVQGEEAPQSIARGIRLAHRYDFDVLIVGRGGGSVEELWAFNEEIVAEAIFQAEIPIISAVGHETDYTIADFVADLRAPTPTAAAELAVPVLEDLNKLVDNYQRRLGEQINRLLALKRKELDGLRNRYAFRYPQMLLRQKEQELDHLLSRLIKGEERYLSTLEQKLAAFRHRLHRTSPQERINRLQSDNRRMQESLIKGMGLYLKQKKDQLKWLIAKMDGASPLKIMSKGYALVYGEERKRMYKSVKEIEPGQSIEVLLHDGILDCQVWGIREDGWDEPAQGSAGQS